MENFQRIRNFLRKTKIKIKNAKNLPLIKVLVRVEEQLRRTSESNPWCVFYDSTSFHRLLLAIRSRKIKKIAFFNNKTQSF